MSFRKNSGARVWLKLQIPLILIRMRGFRLQLLLLLLSGIPALWQAAVPAFAQEGLAEYCANLLKNNLNYFRGGHHPMNRYLRDRAWRESLPPEVQAHLQKYITGLSEEISEYPVFKGITFRGTRIEAKDWDQITATDTFTDLGFRSTSRNIDFLNSDGFSYEGDGRELVSLRIIDWGETGRRVVDPGSGAHRELEVIYPAGTSSPILEKHVDHLGRRFLLLAQGDAAKNPEKLFLKPSHIFSSQFAHYINSFEGDLRKAPAFFQRQYAKFLSLSRNGMKEHPEKEFVIRVHRLEDMDFLARSEGKTLSNVILEQGRSSHNQDFSGNEMGPYGYMNIGSGVLVVKARKYWEFTPETRRRFTNQELYLENRIETLFDPTASYFVEKVHIASPGNNGNVTVFLRQL